MNKKNLKIRLISSLLLLLIPTALLSGCQQQNNPNNKVIKVGTIAGPETTIMETVKEVAEKKHGLKIEIVEFTDYAIPNTALNDGSIDANVFQHLAFLDAAKKAQGFAITPIAKTFIYPMAIYSQKIKNLADLTQDATVAIPNDPSNEARALLLLQKTGLIKLSQDTGFNVTPANITFNPKKLRFKELDAAQLPRSLPDVDVAVINTNYAIPSGLSPSKDSLFIEGVDSPYANLLVVREKEKNDPKFAALIESLHSDEVREAAKKLFGEQAIPAW